MLIHTGLILSHNLCVWWNMGGKLRWNFYFTNYKHYEGEPAEFCSTCVNKPDDHYTSLTASNTHKHWATSSSPQVLDQSHIVGPGPQGPPGATWQWDSPLLIHWAPKTFRTFHLKTHPAHKQTCWDRRAYRNNTHTHTHNHTHTHTHTHLHNATPAAASLSHTHTHSLSQFNSISWLMIIIKIKINTFKKRCVCVCVHVRACVHASVCVCII